MVDMAALAKANASRWAKANLTRHMPTVASALIGAKARYQAVEAKTGVPWFIIAVIHMRESSQNWSRSLAQGDPWNKVSVHVPAGRGPFRSWEEAAIDALANCHPYLAKKRDWSLGPALANLEAYNGLGYATKGHPSPYLWAWTDQYLSGKYVADGKYDPDHVDTQPGCAALIKEMMRLDPSIKFGMSTSTKAGSAAAGTVVIGGTVAATVQQGWSWMEVGLATFIAVGIVAAVIMIIRKTRS